MWVGTGAMIRAAHSLPSPLVGRPEGPSVSPPSLGSAVKWAGMRHPQELGAREVEGFPTHLAAELNVAAATQNQALNALVFLYKEVLKMDLGPLDALRAKRKKYLPVVLTMEEVKRLMEGLRGEDWLRGGNNLPGNLLLFPEGSCNHNSELYFWYI